MSSDLLTPEDVAIILKISYSSVMRLIEAKRLPAFNVSAGRKRKRYRITQEDLDAFMQPKNVPATEKRKPKDPILASDCFSRFES